MGIILKKELLLFCLYMTQTHAGKESGEQALYNDLLANYSSFLRPIDTDNYFQQVVVHAHFGLSQIESLNEREQQLISNGFLSLTWKDELLTWNASYYKGAWVLIVPGEKVWLPEITPVNSAIGATELASLSKDTRVRITSDGNVTWIPALKWETSCSVDVRRFPYDTQVCEIQYGNWMYTATLVNFTVSEKVYLSTLVENEEWKLTNSKAWVHIVNDGAILMPILTMSLTLKRNPTFFELNVLLPAMLLCFLMVPMFMLPVESGEKVSLGVTLMLAYSIFLLMMTDVTPRSGTTPRLTSVILMCIMFAGLSIFLNVIIINIHHHSPYKAVPAWIKNLFIGKLSRLLFCMDYTNNNEVDPYIYINEDFTHVAKNQKLAWNKEYSNDSVKDIIRYLQYFKTLKANEDIMADNKEDWSKVARVLDRLMLCFYCLFVIGTISAVLVLKLINQ